jgi:hypothetical protein
MALKFAGVSTSVFEGTLSRSMPPDSVAAVVAGDCTGGACCCEGVDLAG